MIVHLILQNVVESTSNSGFNIDNYNQNLQYESLNNGSYIVYNYVINGVNQVVLITADKVLIIDPNIVINPFIC